jgi:hypothetical protein
MAWVQDNTTPSGVAWVDDAVQYNQQSMGSLGGLENLFTGPIQTAFAAAGRPGYGGQESQKLISDNWGELSNLISRSTNPSADVFNFANSVLQRAGMRPFSSVDEYSSVNKSLPGHNESLSDISGFADIPGELLSEPGFQALLAAGGAGSMMGPSAGAAGAGGTAGAAMPAAIPESAASLANMGLVQTAPGVWSAAAPAGAGALGGSGFAAGGASAPSAPGAAAPAAGGAATAGGLGGIGSLLSSPTALGMAGGALLGGLGGSQQAGTVTTEEGLPDWLKAYAKPALDKYSTDLQNYQIDPYGVMPSAMKEFQNTISGMYLDPSTNKYLEDYYKLGAERIKGSLSPSFGHMQAFGQHSGYNESLSRGLGDFATGLYGGNYAKERDRQTQLTASAPAFIGQSSQAAFQPYQQYLGTVGSLGKKKDEPYFENPFGNILGGALAGGSLGRIWG